ncbi:unnamed protein product [Citrullus colocynthis]|uniref:Uncharacterized protein n=1 Tax=Citrullus colocynthis TaxID=252529 RepID=A0ABP0XYX7_9ROSI
MDICSQNLVFGSSFIAMQNVDFYIGCPLPVGRRRSLPFTRYWLSCCKLQNPIILLSTWLVEHDPCGLFRISGKGKMTKSPGEVLKLHEVRFQPDRCSWIRISVKKQQQLLQEIDAIGEKDNGSSKK